MDNAQTYDREVIACVAQWLREILPLDVSVEDLPTQRVKLPAAAIQSLTGDPVIKRYKDGSTVKAYRFSVWVRVIIDDETDHFSALGYLNTIVDLSDANKVPPLCDGYDSWQLTCNTLPALYGANEQYEDYQAAFTLKYKKKRRDEAYGTSNF